MQDSPRKSADLIFRAVLGAALGLVAPACIAASAVAEECPGHPDALGTSRVLVVDPAKINRVGVMQYPQSLPLADKEVVLTFDDGPLPPHSTEVLDILAAQCVKATFFLVGEMAREFPSVVRRIHEEGHTIGTHTEHHPLRMQKLPIEKIRAEIDRGIADVGGALWDQKDLAPFFRIPGLARSDAIEKELADRSLVVFSSDTVADDWHRRIKSADITRLALSRLEARGKGILLLHDIHHVTVAALPELLSKLKAAGFHVVHVVPGTAEPTGIAGASPAAAPSNANAPSPAAPSSGIEAAAAQSPAPSGRNDGSPSTPNPSTNSQATAANGSPAHESENANGQAAAPAPSEQMTVANSSPVERSEAPKETPRAIPNNDQMANANVSASPGHNDRDAPASGKPTSTETPQMASDLSRDPDDLNWPKPVVELPAEEHSELPVPDEQSFSTDYRPWRTVKLADGSETAVYLAFDAVPQWTDAPARVMVGSDEAQLPAPEMPHYFGDGETATSIAEWKSSGPLFLSVGAEQAETLK
jgi:peptidoglycan/xylan/chitin deacetylase (PgdA/CDA1 family)